MPRSVKAAEGYTPLGNASLGAARERTRGPKRDPMPPLGVMACFGGGFVPARRRPCANALVHVCSTLPDDEEEEESDSDSNPERLDAEPSGQAGARPCSRGLIAVCSTLPEEESDAGDEQEEAGVEAAPVESAEEVEEEDDEEEDEEEGVEVGGAGHYSTKLERLSCNPPGIPKRSP